jgi:hypothetical protein
VSTACIEFLYTYPARTSAFDNVSIGLGHTDLNGREIVPVGYYADC